MASLNFERLLSTKVRRRQVLIGAGGLTGLAIATQLPTRAIAQAKFSDYPFKLGVASGEPYPDRGATRKNGVGRGSVKVQKKSRMPWPDFFALAPIHPGTPTLNSNNNIPATLDERSIPQNLFRHHNGSTGT